jgi:ParB family transcriptional regulator, chromosome partitioning protein
VSTVERSPGLGRGIGALMNLPEADERPAGARPSGIYFGAEPAEESLAPVPGLRLAELPLDRIRPNRQQPRREFDAEAMEELVHSIRENGVLQPVVVRPMPDAAPGEYELVMGERRLRASKEAGRRTIPAVVKETADDQMLTEALLENLHRSQLNPLEEASAYEQLIKDFQVTHEQLGAKLGRSRPLISNTLRLLNLPRAIQEKVATGSLSAGHARAVLSVVEEDLMNRLVQQIEQEGLSVRQAEAAAIKLQGPARLRKAKGRRSEHLDEVADRLGDRFSTRVRVSHSASRGQIVIDFADIRDLNRILAHLGDPGWGDGEAREPALADARGD